MSGSWHLGNDVVALADPRGEGKAQDTGFLRRVFTQEEREAILSAPNPDLALWIHWAGKEAAFKTVSKSRGTPPVFHHPLFRIRVLPSPPGPETPQGHSVLQGEARFEDLLLSLRIEVTSEFLHALSWIPLNPGESPPCTQGIQEMPVHGEGWRDLLRPRFSQREWACVTHRGSAATRLAARQAMASCLGVAEENLEIGCGSGHPGRRIPRVYLHGEEREMDLTLSHHGRWLGWAFLIP